ncbi:tetratricopeptide repeat protein [Roseiconus nitratireducens]|uniref:Tetratricopeptide repeat protein n=1 Tax=Roseiconus nitratireducens TaxID=2605748 RepID=A0A5M6CWJ3_9BACT|nr:tetratricopeptide repeat protein [Roseiconus nitratireducens]KAA5539584.1 tetratricopeptide repeat protein [Roseiconus nitratireducens]
MPTTKPPYSIVARGRVIRRVMHRAVACWTVAMLIFVTACSPNETEPPANDSPPQEMSHGRQSDSPEPTPKSSPATQTASRPTWLRDAEPPFVGSQACGECHRERADNFNRTAHAESLRLASTADEVTGKAFFHEPSRQQFQVAREGKQLRHQGWQLLPPDGQPLPIGDVAIECVMGSGNFAKSYLFRDHETWLQAPLTYYMESSNYEMSPGYDRPFHKGFTRAISDQCMFCHAGLVSREGENQQRFQIHELAIGCERCHGAGAEHVRQAERSGQTTGDKQQADEQQPWHILRPSALNRSQLESLCAQCHLQGDVTLFTDHNDYWSFRPGEDLGERFIIYRFKPQRDANAGEDDEEIAFVGHFDQLHRSDCYLGSETLTCVTCHNPHEPERAESVEQTRRDHCQACHSEQQPHQECTLDIAERIQRNDNQCWRCHMPQHSTEVPHVAITNHRIAIHPERSTVASGKPSNQDVTAPATATKLPEAIALLDQSPAGSWQRKLNASAAMAAWLQEKADASYRTPTLLNSAIDNLRNAMNAIPDDANPKNDASDRVPVVSKNLADAYLMGLLDLRVYSQDMLADSQQASELRSEIQTIATRLQASEPGATPAYQSAVQQLAAGASRRGDHEEAYRWYSELVQLRRFSADHYNLGLACIRLKKLGEAEQRFYEAIRIQGDYAKAYDLLGRMYQTVDPAQASRFGRLAEQLRAARSP